MDSVEKFRMKYIQISLLSRFLFFLSFAFANWQLAFGLAVSFVPNDMAYVAVIAVVFMSLIVTLILPFIVNLLLNVCSIYTVPRKAYIILTYFCFVAGNTLTGCLNLLTLAMPYAGNWILIISRFIGIVLSWWLLYIKSSKMFFNDANRKYYFKSMAIVFFVIQILGVIL